MACTLQSSQIRRVHGAVTSMSDLLGRRLGMEQERPSPHLSVRASGRLACCPCFVPHLRLGGAGDDHGPVNHRQPGRRQQRARHLLRALRGRLFCFALSKMCLYSSLAMMACSPAPCLFFDFRCTPSVIARCDHSDVQLVTAADLHERLHAGLQQLGKLPEMNGRNRGPSFVPAQTSDTSGSTMPSADPVYQDAPPMMRCERWSRCRFAADATGGPAADGCTHVPHHPLYP